MKLIKTSEAVEVKLSYKEWQTIGKKAGWLSDDGSVLKEAGMGTVSTQCADCKEHQFVSRYNWNAGKAKCKYCGGFLDEAPAPKQVKKPVIPTPVQATDVTPVMTDPFQR